MSRRGAGERKKKEAERVEMDKFRDYIPKPWDRFVASNFTSGWIKFYFLNIRNNVEFKFNDIQLFDLNLLLI